MDDNIVRCERCHKPPGNGVWQCLNCGGIFCDACYSSREKYFLQCQDCIDGCLDQQLLQEEE